jgi:hypothetical protein
MDEVLGTHKLTADHVNAEIAAMRKELTERVRWANRDVLAWVPQMRAAVSRAVNRRKGTLDHRTDRPHRLPHRGDHHRTPGRDQISVLIICAPLASSGSARATPCFATWLWLSISTSFDVSDRASNTIQQDIRKTINAAAVKPCCDPARTEPPSMVKRESKPL